MVVMDASAGVAMALNKPEARSFADLMHAGEKTVAPELYLAEINHVFAKYVRGGMLDAKEACDCATRAVSLVDSLVTIQDLHVEAFSEALRLKHSPYDLFYLVLARRLGATLLTLDRRLATLCLSNGVDCVCDAEAAGEKHALRVEHEGWESCHERTFTREELLGRRSSSGE